MQNKKKLKNRTFQGLRNNTFWVLHFPLSKSLDYSCTLLTRWASYSTETVRSECETWVPKNKEVRCVHSDIIHQPPTGANHFLFWHVELPVPKRRISEDWKNKKSAFLDEFANEIWAVLDIPDKAGPLLDGYVALSCHQEKTPAANRWKSWQVTKKEKERLWKWNEKYNLCLNSVDTWSRSSDTSASSISFSPSS